MLYDPSTATVLHAWLVKTLEPICDAEPDALATYIVALLKHDVPENELRQEVIKQLDEFFESGASNFVETLFAALRSKSYVPYNTAPASYDPVPVDKTVDTGIPIPLDALLSQSTSPDVGQKRSREDDEQDARGPPKGPRLGNDAYFSRHPQSNGNGQQDWQHEGQGGDRDPNGFFGQGGSGYRSYQSNGRHGLPKGVCRDYHLKGFCSRGAMCKFSHDDAAFAPPIPFGAGMGAIPGLPFLPLYGAMPFGMNMAQSPTYDPNDAHMDMRPPRHQRVPTITREDGETGQVYSNPGELPVIQDLTPSRPREERVPIEADGNAQPYPGQDAQMGPSTSPSEGAGLTPQPQSEPQIIRPQRGRGRGRGRGGGRGTFGGDHHSFNTGEHGRDSKTLVVEKIPEEHLSLESVNKWFKRFGTVTNVAVDVSGGKALVSFSTHDEAVAAWKAEEAVFNNRFIKVFWHRPMEGQGAIGARALQASAPLVASMAARDGKAAQTLSDPPKPAITSSPSKTKPSASSAAAALKAKQESLEKQIAEQKELMTKLSKATPDEKKDIMDRLRKLNAEMKSSTGPSSPAQLPTRSSPTPRIDDKEKRKKELLDMELEMHAKTAEDPTPATNEESNENLEEKLAKLRAEAAALGISESSAQSHAPPYRGFRGRGRGRGMYRGAMRGGPPRGSMKLDNRPKSLLVKGISSSDPDATQAIRSFYEIGGQVASVSTHDEDSIIVAFQTRNAAEQALARGTKGINVPSGNVTKVGWFTEVPSVPKPATGIPTIPDKNPTDTGDYRPHSPRPEDTPEETGWGNEEDGMGLF